MLTAAESFGAAGNTVEEVVVTAQKRAENVQRVPLAVSVVSGAEFQQIDALGIADSSALIPSVTFNVGRELRDNAIRIRGVGTDVILPGIEPSVSTVIDGVVLAQQGSFFNDLSDVERVEVLRGPQGTLFGKNASAGVISVITKSPNFQRLEVGSNILVAADHEYRLSSVISAPISPATAFRLGAFYRQNDGVVKDVATRTTFNDVEVYGFRGKLEWRPSDSLDVLLNIDGQRFDSNCCALPIRVASKNPIVPTTGISVGVLNDVVSLGGTKVFARQENYGVSLTASSGVGSSTITYIGAAREWTAEGDFDVDGTPARIVTSNFNSTNARQTSHELRLVSPLYTRADYALGLFYFATNLHQMLDRHGTRINLITGINPDGTVRAPPGSELALVANTAIETRNVSAYGQADFRPADRITLTAGARIIAERQQLDFFRPLPSPFYGVAAFGPAAGDYSDHALIAKGAVSWALTDNFRTFGSYSTGYKGQGLTAAANISPGVFAAQPLEAETSRLWELGVRSQWLDKRLTLNLTGFLTRFKNYQQQALDPALGILVITNAGDVHTNGAEIELAYMPNERLSVSGGITYLDAGYDFRGPCYQGQTAALGCKGGAQDLSRGAFVNAPDLRYTVLARYVQPLTRPSALYGQVSFRWQSEVQFSYDQDPRFVQHSYGIADVKLGLSFGGGRYDLAAFVKNAFDKRYVANVIAQGSAGGGAIVNAIPRDFDRYFGAEFSMRL
jgi:iron complex outermembrane receptor protein